jgi:hypothetical protein
LPALSPPSSAATAALPTRAASSTHAPADELHGGTGGRDRRAAARGLEAAVHHPVALHGDRQANQVPAGGAAGRAVEGVRGLVPAPARVAQMVGEALVGHRAREV